MSYSGTIDFEGRNCFCLCGGKAEANFTVTVMSFNLFFYKVDAGKVFRLVFTVGLDLGHEWSDEVGLHEMCCRQGRMRSGQGK